MTDANLASTFLVKMALEELAQAQQTHLTAIASKIRKILVDADTGPLFAASEVKGLADQWDRFSDEAGGLDVSAWLRKQFGPGRGLPYFDRRDRAMRIIGPSLGHRLNHNAAVWLAENLTKQQIESLSKQLHEIYRRNGFNCVTAPQAVSVARGDLKLSPRHKGCRKCDILRQQLVAVGIEPKA